MFPYARCWCGSPASAAEYNVYGTGVCDNDCSGDGDQDCGGYDTFSLFLVISGDNMEDRAVAIASGDDLICTDPMVQSPRRNLFERRGGWRGVGGGTYSFVGCLDHLKKSSN